MNFLCCFCVSVYDTTQTNQGISASFYLNKTIMQAKYRFVSSSSYLQFRRGLNRICKMCQKNSQHRGGMHTLSHDLTNQPWCLLSSGRILFYDLYLPLIFSLSLWDFCQGCGNVSSGRIRHPKEWNNLKPPVYTVFVCSLVSSSLCFVHKMWCH